MGLGHLGVPWGWVSWGVRRWSCGLGLDGVLGLLDCCFLWRRHAALLGMPVPADVGCQPGGRTVSGIGPGGGFGDLGGALPPGWGYGWAWGAWVLVGVSPGAWVGACAWARLWCGGLRCFGASAGGGSNRGGVNGLYLGVLLSYVVWELTG